MNSELLSKLSSDASCNFHSYMGKNVQNTVAHSSMNNPVLVGWIHGGCSMCVLLLCKKPSSQMVKWKCSSWGSTTLLCYLACMLYVSLWCHEAAMVRWGGPPQLLAEVKVSTADCGEGEKEICTRSHYFSQANPSIYETKRIQMIKVQNLISCIIIFCSNLNNCTVFPQSPHAFINCILKQRYDHTWMTAQELHPNASTGKPTWLVSKVTFGSIFQCKIICDANFGKRQA